MEFTYSSVVDAERAEVFAWHTRPGAMTRLVPPWQPVRVVREAGSLRDGQAVLGLPGGLRWVAAHQPGSYDPPRVFADSLRAVLDPGLSGPVNAVAPEPVRNADYTRTLAGVLRRPAVLPVPKLGPRLLLGGEGARELVQASQYVRPEHLIGAGHQFRQPELEGALRHLFGREPTARPPIRTPNGRD